VYAPNTFGGPAALEPQNPAGGWENDGELTLAAHSLHAEDSDFGQAGTLYREVYDDAAKARFLDTITGAVGGVKRSDIKERAIQYWTNVDAELGAKLRANLGAAPLSDAEAANKIG
jgi:catalase